MPPPFIFGNALLYEVIPKRCYFVILFFKSPGVGVGNGGRVVAFAGVGADVVVVAVVVVGGAVVVVTNG